MTFLALDFGKSAVAEVSGGNGNEIRRDRNGLWENGEHVGETKLCMAKLTCLYS